MVDRSVKILARARAMIGAPFRPQGRVSQTGLDCVGLMLVAFSIDPDSVPRNYRRRSFGLSKVVADMPAVFRRVPRTQRRTGDLLLLKVGPDQGHLAVLSAVGFIHADAALGFVTEVPGTPPWPLQAVFRLRSRSKKEG